MSDPITTETAAGEGAQEQSFEDELAGLATDADGEPFQASKDEGDEPPAKEEPSGEAAGDDPEKPEEGPGDLRVALRQERQAHRKALEQHEQQLAALGQRHEMQVQALLERFAQMMKPPGEEPKPKTIDDDPEGYFDEKLDEKLKPLHERAEREDKAEDQAAVEDLGNAIREYVEADYNAGVEEYGEEVMTKAVEFVIAEELRGIRSRHRNDSAEQVAQRFFNDVLPALHLQYARDNASLAEMAIERAQDAGVLPQDLSTYKAEPAKPAEPAPAKPRSRVTSANRAKPSLAGVSGQSPKGEPTLKEVLDYDSEKYRRWVASEGFDKLLEGLSTPLS